KKRVTFSCECSNQHNEMVMEGKAEVVAPTKKIRRPKAVLPKITLRRPYSLFDVYLNKAKQFKSLRAGVINPIRGKIIEAVHDAYLSGFIDPLLIGPKDRILNAAHAVEIDISNYEIIEVEHSHAAISKAIAMAREDELGVIVRGAATREEL